MKRRPERLDLGQQRVTDALAGDVRDARNIVDRLLRIKLGALAADLVENIDHVRLHIEQAELKYCEQPAGPPTNDEDVGLDNFSHDCSQSGIPC